MQKPLSQRQIIQLAHKEIETNLPEDEPDLVPDWICVLLVKLGMALENDEKG